MKIQPGRSARNPTGRVEEGSGFLRLKGALTRHSHELQEEEECLRKVWWVNTVCLAIFAVGILGVERVMPFMPRATAAAQPAFQIPPTEHPVEKRPEPRPEPESAKSEDGGPAELPQIPEPAKFEGMGDEGGKIPEPINFRNWDEPRDFKRVPFTDGGGRGGSASGKVKPEEFTGRGKRGKQGYVPEPDILDMPRALQDELPRGKVIMKLWFKVSGEGKIVEIHLDQSSGNALLDRFIVEWYKRKGTFVSGDGERVFVETLSLRLPE